MLLYNSSKPRSSVLQMFGVFLFALGKPQLIMYDIIINKKLKYLKLFSPERSLISTGGDQLPAQVTTQKIDINRIVTQYHTELLRMAFFYLKDTHLAEDAVQEAFIRAYKYQGQFKGNCSEKTWVTQITINVCKSFLKSSWSKNVGDEEALNSITVEDETVKIDDTVILEVMKLPAKYKDVILLFYYQDLRIKEISSAFKIPERTVATRLSRAREMLNKKLKGWYFDE
jgi:RNA polymerase sigma factor, sigma-70 family